MNKLIEQCANADGCRAMEQELKRRGLWRAYAAILTGTDKRPENVSEDEEALWGWSWKQRRNAAYQVMQ